MLDTHVHLEHGPYTLEWVQRFVDTAVTRGVREIGLLDHSYLFKELLPMYDGLRARSAFVDAWLDRKAGVRTLSEYVELMKRVRERNYPVKIRFGIEVCYLEGAESFIRERTKDLGLDFLVGSVHFVDDFAFDHTPELWEGADVDSVYRRFFETSLDLVHSGIFDGLAHPDSIKLFGHTPSFPLEPYYERLADALAEAGMYAEQNSGVSRRAPAAPGMAPALLKAVLSRGVTVRTASDAHYPEEVGDGIAEFIEKSPEITE